MTNAEILSARFTRLTEIIRNHTGARTKDIHCAVRCNGCREFFPYPDCDFALWRIGAFGADQDYCPACWT